MLYTRIFCIQNFMKLSDTYMCQQAWHSLVQIMACLQKYAKPLSEQMLAYCSLSGMPDYFDRNKILSGYDLSHYQVLHCIKSFLLFCLICVYSSQFSILFWIMYLL